jgi:recombinational DNA repair ATPase RecF
MDNHTTSSLYEAFPPQEAFEISQRLETHYTPKHGSWLNIAEIELSAMTSQCLNGRINTLDKLNNEVQAWQHDRNRNQKTVQQFKVSKFHAIMRAWAGNYSKH